MLNALAAVSTLQLWQGLNLAQLTAARITQRKEIRWQRAQSIFACISAAARREQLRSPAFFLS